MATSFTQRVSIPDHVMFRELEGESVILDLDSESYFGLNQVGTRAWQVLAEGGPIQDAYDALLAEFEVDAETLRADLLELVDDLAGRHLLEIHGERR